MLQRSLSIQSATSHSSIFDISIGFRSRLEQINYILEVIIPIEFFCSFQKVFKNFIDVRIPTPIEDETYDVIICCAGFFQSLISPLAFPELIRITKKGGLNNCLKNTRERK